LEFGLWSARVVADGRYGATPTEADSISGSDSVGDSEDEEEHSVLGNLSTYEVLPLTTAGEVHGVGDGIVAVNAQGDEDVR